MNKAENWDLKLGDNIKQAMANHYAQENLDKMA